MGLPNKDEIEGKLEQAKGVVKEKLGHVVGNEKLEAKGDAEQARGKLQSQFGRARRIVGDDIAKIGRVIGK